MKKLITWCIIASAVFSIFFCVTLLKDKQYLRNELIRLHVVGNSNSTDDQRIKLSVRDAILAYLTDDMISVTNVTDARTFLQNHLYELETVANEALKADNSKYSAEVSLTKEPFGTRKYDTFSLPSGVYESLRIDIGQAQGKNWWCVVFPTLCVPKTTEAFSDTAQSNGVRNGLSDTLSNDRQYHVRFYLLDCLGKLENLFFLS